MKDNKKAAESFQENGSNFLKNVFGKAKAAVKGAKRGAKAIKWVASFIAGLIGPIGVAILIFFIIVVAVLIFALASIFPSYYNDSSQTFSDESLGNACNVQQAKVYEKMQKVWDKMILKLDEEMETQIASLFDGNYSISSSDITKSNISDNGTSWTYIAEVNDTSKENAIYRTIVSVPVQLQVYSPQQLMNTIAGYIEANYATIYSYNDMAEDMQEVLSNKKTVNVTIDKTDGNGNVVTSESCVAHGGTVENNKCKNYTYIPKQKNVSKTGTCTYKDGNWETTGDASHTCSDEEWARKKNSTSADSSPTDGSTYTYSYVETKENVEISLDDFDLDDFDSVIDAYIESDSLMYYTLPDKWTEKITISSEETTQKVDNYVTCTKADVGCDFADDPSAEIGTMNKPITINIYTKRAELSDPINIEVGTNVDSSDSKFLAEERSKTIKNIEMLAEAKGETASGEYVFNEAVYFMGSTLNFLCPDYNIDFSLITGSSYSSFGAIDSSVDTPGVFGNEAYWYDSSKGVWDRSQLARQDVFDAIWSYDAYLVQNGLVTQSGWWSRAENAKSGNPQCTDFVHARFYAQYGFDCGNGNGRDIARATVSKYPDKFTNGTVNGAITIKAGSIISTTTNADPIYGHVGFVEAVETDDNGNIKSITISDANFTKAGAPGGVRLHCVYTWEQFVSTWGLGCEFAIPIN